METACFRLPTTRVLNNLVVAAKYHYMQVLQAKKLVFGCQFVLTLFLGMCNDVKTYLKMDPLIRRLLKKVKSVPPCMAPRPLLNRQLTMTIRQLHKCYVAFLMSIPLDVYLLFKSYVNAVPSERPKPTMLVQYLALLFPFLSPPIQSPPQHVAKNMIDCRPPDDNPNTRLSIPGIGSELVGFPSTGGVYVLTSPHPILLQFPSLDRFTTISSQRFSDSAAEDAFCLSMRKIGATWWPSLLAHLHRSGGDCFTTGENRACLHRLAKDRGDMVYEYEGELIEMAVDSSLSLEQATVRHVELIGTS